MELKEVKIDGDNSSVVVRPNSELGVFALLGTLGWGTSTGDHLVIGPVSQATAEHIEATQGLSALDFYLDEPAPGLFRAEDGAEFVILDSTDARWRNRLGPDDSVIELNPASIRQFTPVDVSEVA